MGHCSSQKARADFSKYFVGCCCHKWKKKQLLPDWDILTRAFKEQKDMFLHIMPYLEQDKQNFTENGWLLFLARQPTREQIKIQHPLGFFFFFWFVVRFNSKLLMPSALHILRCVLSSCFCRRCVIWSWKANRAIDGVSFQISHGYSSWHDVLDKTAFCVRYVVPVPASLPEALTDTVDHWTQTLHPDPISTVKEEEPSLSTSSAKAPKPKRARGAKS